MKASLQSILMAGFMAAALTPATGATAAGTTAAGATTNGAPPASAATAVVATGLWYDHTGRGAVEISDCGGKLCGKIVWLKDTKNAKGCGIQVLANVPPVGPNTWDGGWIYDPEENSKYDVELKLLSADKLKVTGYAGVKFLGETMMWTRAPMDIQRCQ